MSSLEHRAVKALLRRIRARRDPAQREENGSVKPTRCVEPPKLRQAEMADFPTITELKVRGGIVVDPYENWKRLWIDNPAFAAVEGLAMGWVLEARGKIVGYLGNIALPYCYEGKRLTAVAGSGFVVDPEYRGASLSLNSAFYRQKSVDIHLSTTAIESVGKLARAFRSAALPQPDYDSILFWVLQPYGVAKALAKKLDLARPIEYFATILSSLAVSSDTMLRHRWPSECATDLDVIAVSVGGIGDEFEAFWQEKLNQKPRFYADRSAATLRWHFQVPGHNGSVRVLCCRRRGRLVGYAIVRNDFERPGGLKRTLIADLLVHHDDLEVVRALLVASFGEARHFKSHILEVIGFPPEIRQAFREAKPYVRRLPACPFYYRASDPALHRALADSSVWYAGPYDGDTTLMP